MVTRQLYWKCYKGLLDEFMSGMTDNEKYMYLEEVRVVNEFKDKVNNKSLTKAIKTVEDVILVKEKIAL